MPEPPAPPPAPDRAAIEAGDLTQPADVPLTRADRATLHVAYDMDHTGNSLSTIFFLRYEATLVLLEAENARLRAGLVEMRGLSMHSDWCWSESVRVDIDRLLRGETLPGQES